MSQPSLWAYPRLLLLNQPIMPWLVLGVGMLIGSLIEVITLYSNPNLDPSFTILIAYLAATGLYAVQLLQLDGQLNGLLLPVPPLHRKLVLATFIGVLFPLICLGVVALCYVALEYISLVYFASPVQEDYWKPFFVFIICYWVVMPVLVASALRWKKNRWILPVAFVFIILLMNQGLAPKWINELEQIIHDHPMLRFWVKGVGGFGMMRLHWIVGIHIPLVLFLLAAHVAFKHRDVQLPVFKRKKRISVQPKSSDSRIQGITPKKLPLWIRYGIIGWQQQPRWPYWVLFGLGGVYLFLTLQITFIHPDHLHHLLGNFLLVLAILPILFYAGSFWHSLSNRKESTHILLTPATHLQRLGITLVYCLGVFPAISALWWWFITQLEAAFMLRTFAITWRWPFLPAWQGILCGLLLVLPMVASTLLAQRWGAWKLFFPFLVIILFTWQFLILQGESELSLPLMESLYKWMTTLAIIQVSTLLVGIYHLLRERQIR